MNLLLLGFVAQLIVVFGMILLSEYGVAYQGKSRSSARDSKKDF